jgi:hypothetical protein
MGFACLLAQLSALLPSGPLRGTAPRRLALDRTFCRSLGTHSEGESGHLGFSCRHFPMDTGRQRPLEKRYLNPRARRALELLASNALGLTEAFMLAHGFTRTMVAALVRAEFVTTQREAIGAGGKLIKIARIEITASGRRALEADRRNPPSWPAIGDFPPL